MAIKSRMGLAGCVASMGEIKNSYKILDTKPEVKRSLGNIGIDGMVILKSNLINRV